MSVPTGGCVLVGRGYECVLVGIGTVCRSVSTGGCEHPSAWWTCPCRVHMWIQIRGREQIRGSISA